MYLQGATLQGGKYGAVSPKDFSGLASWHRATDGIEFYQGNYINKWKDLSGNGRHLTAYNGITGLTSTNGGILANTINGLSFVGTTSTSSVLACTTDTEFKKMLYDGRPISLIIIFRIINYQITSGFSFFFAGSSTTNCGRFVIGSPTNNQSIRTYNQNNAAVAVNDIVSGTYTSSGGHILSLIDYGYDINSPLLHRKTLLDGIEKSGQKFNAPPSTLVDTTPIILQGGAGANNIYEIILYDNTGKTKTQIDYEYSKLYNDYLLKRYPNLFL